MTRTVSKQSSLARCGVFLSSSLLLLLSSLSPSSLSSSSSSYSTFHAALLGVPFGPRRKCFQMSPSCRRRRIRIPCRRRRRIPCRRRRRIQLHGKDDEKKQFGRAIKITKRIISASSRQHVQWSRLQVCSFARVVALVVFAKFLVVLARRPRRSPSSSSSSKSRTS